MGWLAGLMVFLTCTAMGVAWRRRLYRRERILNQMLLLLRQMRNRTMYLHLPFSDLVASLCTGEDFSELTFLQDCAMQCATGMAFPKAWRTSVQQFGRTGAWTVQTGKEIARLGEAAAGADAQSVDGVLALYEKMLERAMNTTVQENREKGKNCVQICSAVGLLLGILMI